MKRSKTGTLIGILAIAGLWLPMADGVPQTFKSSGSRTEIRKSQTISIGDVCRLRREARQNRRCSEEQKVMRQ
jgi:hypothetical protein